MSNWKGEVDNPFQTSYRQHAAALATTAAGFSVDHRTRSSSSASQDSNSSGFDFPTETQSDIGPASGSTLATGRSLALPSREPAAQAKRSYSYGAAAAAAAAVLTDARASLQHGRSVLPHATTRVPSSGEAVDSPVGPLLSEAKVSDELARLEVTYREEVDTAIQRSNGGGDSAQESTLASRNSPRQTESDFLGDGDVDSADESDYVDFRGSNEFGRLDPTYLEDVLEWRSTGRLPCPVRRDIATGDLKLDRLPQSTTGPSTTVDRRPWSQAVDSCEYPEDLPFRARELVQRASSVQMRTGSGSEDAPNTGPSRGDPIRQSDCRVNEELLHERPPDLNISNGRYTLAGESLPTNTERPEPTSPLSPDTQPGAYSEVQGSRDQAPTSDSLTDYHENESLRTPSDFEDPMECTNPDDVEFQRKIRQIVNHPTMSDQEKNVRRQALFAENYNRSRTAAAVIARDLVVAQAREKSFSRVTDPNTGELLLGCQHYPRNCKIQAKCCGLWCVCRLCHDSQDMALGHNINRKETERIMCMFCLTEQPVSNQCISCKETFARYFCSVCVFYDNTPDKDVYHCSDCGICRVGKGLGKDNFHCKKCNACVSIDSRESHNCIAKSLDANCPICSIYLFTSTDPVVFMRCGHTMHSHCKIISFRFGLVHHAGFPLDMH
jgi:CHY zinc finger